MIFVYSMNMKKSKGRNKIKDGKNPSKHQSSGSKGHKRPSKKETSGFRDQVNLDNMDFNLPPEDSEKWYSSVSPLPPS